MTTVKKSEALGFVGKELKENKWSVLLHEPVVHLCLNAAHGQGDPSDQCDLGLEEGQRFAKASLQGALEQTKALQLQKQWVEKRHDRPAES